MTLFGTKLEAQPGASFQLGQYRGEDLSQPAFDQYGPNGGPSGHGLRLWARGVGTTLFQARYPTGIAYDPARKWIFVADTNNHRVLAFAVNASGAPLARDAALVLGQPDAFTTLADNTAREDLEPPAPTPDARNLLQPTAVAFDATRQRLFVADQARHRVLVFDLSSGVQNGMAAVAVLGQADFSGGAANRGAAISGGGLAEPAGLAFDAARNFLWVSDNSNHRVLAFDLTGGLVSGLQARHVLGQADTTSGLVNRGGSTSAQTLRSPRGLALRGDGSMLFVADEQNHRVLGFDLGAGISSGMPAARVLGQADFSANIGNRNNLQALPETLYQPFDLAIDPVADRLLVADARNHRIAAYRLTGLANGQAAELALGTTSLTHAVPDGIPPPSATTMNFPTAVAVVADRVLVTDFQNHRVVAFNRAALATGMAATDVLGQYTEGDLTRPSFLQQGANNGPTSFEFDHSDGVSSCAVDPSRHWLAVADALNGRILIFTLDAAHRFSDRRASFVLGTANFQTLGGTAIAQNTIRRPQRMVFDDRNRLFVADDQASRILVYDFSAGITNGMPASFVLGKPDFVQSSRTGGANGINRARGVSYDAAEQRLFVADTDNHRILVFDLKSGLQNGMAATAVLGQANFTAVTANAGSALGAAGLSGPRDVAYDGATKRLFVADTGNLRVLGFDLSGGIVNGQAAAVVLGQPDFTTKTAATSRSRIDDVGSLAWDAVHRRLFVASRLGRRTLVYSLTAAPTTGMDAVAVLGQPTFLSDLPLPGREYAVAGNIAYDPVADVIYALDQTNQESALLVFPAQMEMLGGLPNPVIGQAYRTRVAAGGLGPLSFQVTAGSLPPGLQLDPASGLITGTVPAGTSGVFFFTVTGTDALNRTVSSSVSLSVAAFAPEVEVQGNALPVAAGDATPTVEDGTDFGAIVMNRTITHLFTIKNTGLAPLTLSGAPIVTLSGANAADFAIVQPAAGSVAAREQITFGVAFTPSAAGLRSASVSFANNDTDESPYVFALAGTGIVAEAGHAVKGAGYLAGQTVTVTNVLTYSGALTAFDWDLLLPAGWSFASDTATSASSRPVASATSTLKWRWTTVPASPVTFTYVLNVPAGATTDASLAAVVTLTRPGITDPVQVLVRPDPLLVSKASRHSADSNGDFEISLFELTRVIELYNTRYGTTRTGSYKLSSTSEDGFAVDATRPVAGTTALSRYHSGDSNRDGQLSLAELTRVIELYNSRDGTVRTGRHHVQAGTEDGFAPGP